MSVWNGRFVSLVFAYVQRQAIDFERVTTDYETVALPAELRRREAGKTLHPAALHTSTPL
jgi:hypothetical protein